MKTEMETRNQAAEHFQWRVDQARRFNEDVAYVESDVRLGLAIVDLALKSAPGEFISTNELYEPGRADMDNCAQLLRVLPFLAGSLQLLDIVFWHETYGEVENTQVKQLMDDQPVQVGNITLTANNVRMRIRRKPSNPPTSTA